MHTKGQMPVIRAATLLAVAIAAVWAFAAVPASAAAPVIISESVSDVTASSARLEAVLEPAGAPTEFYFEYGATNAYGTRLPSSPGTLAAGTAKVTVSEELQGLASDTSYHYRIVGSSGGETAYGEDHVLTTQSTVTGPLLPDGRAWELVSPAQKFGARLEAITIEGGVSEAAENGSAMTYVANAPVDEPEGNPSLGYSQILSVRKPNGGWTSRDLATPHEEANGVRVGFLTEYFAFSPTLTSAVVEPWGEYQLSPAASEKTLYMREDLLEGNSTQYTPIVEDADVAPGTHYGKSAKIGTGAVNFLASSANADHVVVGSTVPLLTKNPEANPGLYEWTAGSLAPISILPDGDWLSRSYAVIGNKNISVRGAISNDGKKVFWTGETESGAQNLYMRDVPEEQTIQLDQAQGVAEPPTGEAKVEFQYATPDGSRVYFADERRLTSNSNATEREPELYEYDTESGILTDLTPDPHGTSAALQGQIIGASENGEYVYYIADGALAEGLVEGEPASRCDNRIEAEVTCDLYVDHVVAGHVTPRLIAVLSGEDIHDSEQEFRHPGLFDVTSRMSPNGRYLAFMSDRSLTGYDNDDAVSGAADEEVYLYDAETQQLTCASCNPTDARPHGVFDTHESSEGLGLLVDRPETWENRWLAASLPGWTAWQVGAAQYQSRYLSNEGRLFFDAADSLVPEDTNGKEDVYEFEPEDLSSGVCSAATTDQSEVFKPSHKFEVDGRAQEEQPGCVGLISSGTADRESAFLDASESGDDVFFLTSAQLTPEDVDSSYDVYDAHMCSAATPCPVSTPDREPCDSSSTCEQNAEVTGGGSESPPSSTPSGFGNLSPVPAVRTVPPPSRKATVSRKERLKKALHACGKVPKAKRKDCDTRAEKLYGEAKKAKKAAPVRAR